MDTADAAPAGSSAATPAATTIVPPRLLEQIALDYPEEARSSGEHGDVSILVDVDASGRVVKTRFESGPEVFRENSLRTASRLTFAPATADGIPVAATTRVSFHFAPPEASDGGSDSTGTAEMVIHSSSPDLKDTRARTTLDEKQLERTTGEDFAQTVSQVAGVRIGGTAADASKPIIRGQQERRLLVLNNGVRHESQKWGPDHATEIDPFSAGSSASSGAAGALRPRRDRRCHPVELLRCTIPACRQGPRPTTRMEKGLMAHSRRRRLGLGLVTRRGYAARSQPLATPEPSWATPYRASGTRNFGHTWDSCARVLLIMTGRCLLRQVHGTPMRSRPRSRRTAQRLRTSDGRLRIERPYQDVTHDIGTRQRTRDWTA